MSHELAFRNSARRVSSRPAIVCAVALVVMARVPGPQAAPELACAFREFPVTGRPRLAAVGDWNGDGIPDVACTSNDAGSGKLVILLGRGDGTLVSGAVYPEISGVTGTAAADFNHDGVLDLATASAFPSGVAVRFGNGDGSFGDRQPYAASAVRLAVGDLDSDGNLDLILSTPTLNFPPDSGVTVLRGQGDGHFGAARRFKTGVEILSEVIGQDLALADFNGDGALDVVAIGVGSAAILLGDGAGGFGPPTPLPLPGALANVCAGDFNGDGQADLVIAAYSAGMSVLLGHGDGSFDAAVPAEAHTSAGRIAVRDLDGDLRDDLAVTTSAGLVRVLLSNGDGSFRIRHSSWVDSQPSDVLIQDLDHDARPDLIVVCSSSQSVATFLAMPDTTFGAHLEHPISYTPVTLAVADLDRDGSPDLLVPDRVLGWGVVAWGKPMGFFGNTGTPPDTTRVPCGVEPYGVTTGDLNGDSIPDIAVTLENDHAVRFVPGLANRAFGPGITLPVDGFATGCIITDLDGDGRPDLGVAVYTSNRIAIFHGTLDGPAPTPTFIESGPLPFVLRAGDLTEDGFVDLVAPNYGGATLSFFPSVGPGLWGPRQDLPVGQDPADAAVVDLDHDGHLDIVVVNFLSSSVSVLRGLGGGAFLPTADYATDYLPQALSVADLDGDGRLDLILACRGAGTVCVLSGLGDGTFGERQSFGVGATDPYDVEAADFDRDGDLDVAVCNALDGSVSILKNLSIVPPLTVPGSSPAHAVLGAPFPSPARHSFRLPMSTTRAATVRLELIDLTGRVRMRRELAISGAGTASPQVEVPDAVGPGVYFVRMTHDGFTATHKVVLLR